MRKLDQKQYAASAADAKAPSEGNQINANEAINVIHVPYESTPVKVAYEFLAMNAPYKEMERRAFPAYIQKIADLLTYDCGSFVVNGTAVVGKEKKSPYNHWKSTQKGADLYEINI